MKLFFVILLFISQVLYANGSQPLPYFATTDFTPFWKFEQPELQAARIDSFTAINQNGNKMNQEELKQNISLVNFFFVSCPGICPMMMKNVQALQKALKNETVNIFSFSIQPQMDSPENLREYAKDYKINLKNWTLLTGKKSVIYKVGKDMFKADASVGKQKSPDNFIHTQNLYMLDTKLFIRGIYNTSNNKDMTQLISDLKILKNEKN